MTVIPFTEISKNRKFKMVPKTPPKASIPDTETPIDLSKRPTALVYCEGNFGHIDGKTANGLVRYSEKYEILSVIDSTRCGSDAGDVLDNKPNSIPIYRNLNEALTNAKTIPDFFIYGMAPATGMLSPMERIIIIDAMRKGMNIVNGLHEFLNDDPEFFAAGVTNNVTIIDIRRPRPKSELRLFSGKINSVKCPRITVLGTDCAIGKRTTANVLTNELIKRGIKAVMVTTGQTGMIQGSRYGVALDAVPSQFCAGELEATIVEA